MPGLFDPQGGGGILGGLSNLLGSVQSGIAGPQYQLARQEFQWKMGLYQAQADAMRRAGIPEDKIMAIMQDPNGPAAQMQYGPPKQYEGPTYGADTYKPPGPVFNGQAGQFQPINAPQVTPQMTATPQNRIEPGTSQAAPGVGGPATAGIPVPPELQTAAPVMDYLRGKKAEAAGQEAAAKTGAESATELKSKIESGALDSIDQTIKLIDDAASDPAKRWATGLMANSKFFPGMPAYGYANKIEQIKNRLSLDLLPTLQRGGRTSPALLEYLQKSTAGQELNLGNPNFDEGLQNTRDALVKIRQGMQAGAHIPITEAPAQPGPPTFKNQAELRAAIKAKQIKVGDPFRTGDGRTLLAQ